MFKAYDIRGICPAEPEELTEEVAEKIGLAAGRLIPGRTIVVGRDMRLSGPALAAALIRGLTRAGKDVVDIGQVTSPMVTFAVARFGYDGGVMTTASHKGAEYNGFKLCGKGAEPISKQTGVDKIEKWVTTADLPEAPEPGSVTDRDVLPEDLDHVLSAAGPISGIKLVVDAGNGMAGYLMPPLFERIDAELVPLYFEIDGSFPNHEANPLEPENLVDLQKKVVEVGADLGVAFDGDADRLGFVDGKGNAVSCDIVTALIAREVLANEPGAAILYDLRSSWAVRKEIEAHGGVPVETAVGHSLIKAKMREHDAAFGGELSGHYYFRENFYCDSGAFILLKVLSLVCRERKPFSQLVAPLLRYYHSGEINSDVEDKEGKVKEIERAYVSGKVSHLDGLKVEFDDWWFNVRPSNTEEKLRLVVEGNVLHVVPTPDWTVQFEQVAPMLDADFFDEMERSAAERLERVVPREARKGFRVTTAVRRGTAFLEIIRYAKEQRVDLITIATHGRTGLRHALFGSVAEKVVRKAPCPVLSIRPEGHDFAMP
jgi:phosphomannomutase